MYEDEWDVLAGDSVAVGYNQDEIIGAQEIIGNHRRAIAQRMARARDIDPHAALVAPRQLNNRRRKILGTPEVSVPAGGQATLTFKTQELYRPERFVVDTTSAPLVIVALNVGTSSQLAAIGDIPAEIFRPDAVDVDVHFQTANVGNDITVTFRNPTIAAITARAAFIGTSIS